MEGERCRWRVSGLRGYHISWVVYGVPFDSKRERMEHDG